MEKFAYQNAATVAQAIAFLKAGHAAVLAGGTDILNLMKTGAFTHPPRTLVNIKNIPELDSIQEDMDGLAIGATVKLAHIASSEMVKSKYPALARAAGSVASPPVREMGTIAGNLCQQVQCWYFRRSPLTGTFFDCPRKGGSRCHAVAGDNRYHAILGATQCFAVCPSDTAVALAALDAVIGTTKRSIPMGSFFQALGNVLDEDEIVARIWVPTLKSGTRQVFIKFALRPAMDFALASVAAAITVELGKVSEARIVLGAVAPAPYRAKGAEDALQGNAISEHLAETAAAAAVRDAVPLTNNKYKVQIIKALVKRAILG
jgi:xanthine dehydrogenase YagS FAD-binding subunit